VDKYLGKLTVFLRCFDNRPLETMGEAEIREFLLYQLDLGKSSGTVNIYNSALRFIFGAVLGKKLNYQMIPRRRHHRELPSIMSKTEIVRFFSVIDNLQDKAMFETVYGAGLRISEIIRLRVQDIDSKPMLDVQNILEHYGEAYLQNHNLSSVQYKAWNAILNCRTSRLGGHMDRCPKCGYERSSYNSCRNRHCPKCQTFSKERWIEAQKADLLNVGYFHVVFTVPQELNMLIYRNQRNFYNLLFRCAAESLQELADDKKYLGAAIGITAVLHTCGQNLCFHPHIHCIVPSGGLTSLSKWQPSRKKFFLPVRVLSSKFRGKFKAMLRLKIPDLDQNLLNQCYRKEWVVYCKPPFKDAVCVMEYLGRYTHRVAISNNRILKIDNGTVTFKWRDYRDKSR
jgi:predicted Zn-ribbon and HTH transcriptional regulator